MFSLADLYEKVISSRWHGSIKVPEGQSLCPKDCKDALNRFLSSDVNWRPGDRILVRCQHPIHSIALMLAAWKMGIVVVPLKEDTLESAIYLIAIDCNAKAIWQNGSIESLSSYSIERPRIQLSTAVRVTGVDLALLIYTSGSTGTPKGIALSHQNVITSLESISNYLKLESSNRILCLSPLSFDYGLYQVLFSLYSDCETIVYTGKFNPIQILRFIEQEEITTLPVVPAIGASLIKIAPIVKPDLSHLKCITNTGGHLSDAIIHEWKQYSPNIKIYSMYGLTECKRAMYLEPEMWDTKSGSVGKPIPGLDARILIPLIDQSDHFREANPHEIGELYVRGSAVMQRYYNENSSAGARVLNGYYRDDNWLATGDLFSRDEDGYYYFKGRSKELIKQGGFCLYPKDIESAIEKNTNVKLCAVIGWKDKFDSEIAVLVVELNEDTESERVNFKRWLLETLDSDYAPRDIHYVQSIALNANSKVDKKKLLDCIENNSFA